MTNDIKQRLAFCGASAEAMTKLQKYVELIQQWNKAINLISPSTLGSIWERHILDSAQLWPIISQHSATSTRIIDLGSGGGLPALVLAMMGADHVTMVESDRRKCIFLQEVSRETCLTNVTIINERIESVSGIKAPVVTARALASLLQLASWAAPFVEEKGVMVFPKGQDWHDEVGGLTEHFDDDFVGRIDRFQSITDDSARIVLIHS